MIASQAKAAPAVKPNMVSKCANPGCNTPFRFLHEGRIFTDHYHGGHQAGASIERYWLCSRCCDSMTLVIEAGEVRLRALAAIPESGIKPAVSAASAGLRNSSVA